MALHQIPKKRVAPGGQLISEQGLWSRGLQSFGGQSLSLAIGMVTVTCASVVLALRTLSQEDHKY